IASVVDLQPLRAAMQRHLELVFAGIDAGADHAMLAHLPRPFLVMRTHGSFNHPGPDEEPTAILLLSAALAASVGHDPTIGGPARVAPRAGPFFTERPTISLRANTRLGRARASRETQHRASGPGCWVSLRSTQPTIRISVRFPVPYLILFFSFLLGSVRRNTSFLFHPSRGWGAPTRARGPARHPDLR